jgi:hypothetical protein
MFSFLERSSMAAAIAGFFQTPNNITLGTWNWGDVAYGFRSGLFLNQGPLRLISYNNLPHSPNVTSQALMSNVMMPFNTVGKVTKLAQRENWIGQHKQAFLLGIFALMGANGYAAQQELYNKKFSQTRSPLDKFFIAIWRTTPYLVLLTHIALTIIELRVNRMKALVGLTVTAVTLLDQAQVLPRSIAGYINPGVRLPMDCIALYYGSNKNRFWIVLGWTQVPFIRNWLRPLLPTQLRTYV